MRRLAPLRRALLLSLAAALCGTFAAAQNTTTETKPPSTQPAATQPWEAGERYPDWSAPSTLEITNDCKRDHSFAVSKQNADFLDLQFQSPVRVRGKKSVTQPVRFHTDGMPPGDYIGQVTVLCTDCTEMPPCVQDRKLLAPHIRVIPRPINATDQLQKPPQPTSPRCAEPRPDCEKIRARLAEVEKEIAAAEKDEEAAHASLVQSEQQLAKAQAELNDAERANSNYLGAGGKDPKTAKNFRDAFFEAAAHWLTFKMFADAAKRSWQEKADQLDELEDQADFLFTMYLYCWNGTKFCQLEGPLQACTQDHPCTRGWTECKDDECGEHPPQLCTTDHPCTGGIAAIPPPPPAAKSTCTQTKEDCEQLRRAAERKEAAAQAAQKAADEAAAEARSAEAAARNTTGKSIRDVAALQERARNARANADAMQKLADHAEGVAAAARRVYEECLKKAQDDCPLPPAQTPPNKAPCTVAGEDCEKFRLAWQEAERQAAIAQALADRAAQEQQRNNAEADYLDQQSANEEKQGKIETDHARQWRDLAAGAAALAAKDRELAAGSPAGSKDRTFWTQAAKDDTDDVAKYNSWAAELEASEMQYHQRAAEEAAKARQLRGGSGDAQAKADAAKASAATAKKAYEDCLERDRRRQAECPKTVSPPTTTRSPSAVSSTTPPPPGAPGTISGGNTRTPPKIGLAGVPVANRTIDPLQTVQSPFCQWRNRPLPRDAELENVFLRNPTGNAESNRSVEAKAGDKTSLGHPTIAYHCMTDNGSAVVSYTYHIGTEAHVGRLLVSCTGN